jgi:hypothetical protein
MDIMPRQRRTSPRSRPPLRQTTLRRESNDSACSYAGTFTLRSPPKPPDVAPINDVAPAGSCGMPRRGEQESSELCLLIDYRSDSDTVVRRLVSCVQATASPTFRMISFTKLQSFDHTETKTHCIVCSLRCGRSRRSVCRCARRHGTSELCAERLRRRLRQRERRLGHGHYQLRL